MEEKKEGAMLSSEFTSFMKAKLESKYDPNDLRDMVGVVVRTNLAVITPRGEENIYRNDDS